MNIRDFLNATFPGPFQATKIHEYLKRSDKPGYKLLYTLIAHHHGDAIDRNFRADSVVEACDALGISDTSDLNRFVQDPLSAEFIDAVTKAISRDFDKFPWENDLTVEYNLMEPFHSVNAGSFPLRDEFRWDNLGFSRDPYTKIMPIGAGCIRDLFTQSRVSGRQYVPHQRDCDDMAIMFMAELAEQYRGDYAIGMLEFTAYDVDDNSVYRHALNFSVHEKPTPLFDEYPFFVFDPVSREIWNRPEDTPLYVPDQAYIKLDKIWI